MSLTRTELLNEFYDGWFECGRWQVGLIAQLQGHVVAIKASGTGGASGGKPKSKPPMSLEDLDLFYECVAEAKRVDEDVDVSLSKIERLRSRARMVLGYEVGVMRLPEVVCHQCGGPLEVARDASSGVVCVERCGVEYPTTSWLELLQQKEEQ